MAGCRPLAEVTPRVETALAYVRHNASPVLEAFLTLARVFLREAGASDRATTETRCSGGGWGSADGTAATARPGTPQTAAAKIVTRQPKSARSLP